MLPSTRRGLLASGVLALASTVAAQTDRVCFGTDVCFTLNIPANTASSGNGDIFFQLSAPSDYEWVALGQGTRMSGSNMFIVYTSSNGNNVTLSPRLADGYSPPSFNGDAQVTLLGGSGVFDGKMIANVRCSSCNSWSGGGSASFSGSNGNWVYAYQSSGGPKNSDSTSAGINQHNSEAAFRWEYANAKGGNSVNPLLVASASGSASGSATSCVPRPAVTGTESTSLSGAAATTAATKTGGGDNRPWKTRWSGYPTASPTAFPYGPDHEEHDKRQEINYCDSPSNGGTTIISASVQPLNKAMLIAHGVLASLAFVVFFPAGAIAIRLASFPGVVWFHAAFQVFAYVVYIVAFGLGVYIANSLDMLDENHPIIGIVIFAVLFLQPILGLLHHMLFKKYRTRTLWSYCHIWIGRAVVTLGIINGGLGFKLADTMNVGSKTGMIVYSVVAGIMWLVWVAAMIIGESRRKKTGGDRPPKYTESPPGEANEGSDNIPLNDHGHYAPKRQ
ncbi:iron reductase domain protein [Amniculicola lignicola CBS 123094]|uniref:Iron reductase domain protein n=1 Tax=Amniculicola lignicola CBS 123094 TaxID=1392246 RepID=A0A6A5WFT5_9PLEO|nr:iron reductase domain protein [Amniculicola lignicola CBS 123094]